MTALRQFGIVLVITALAACQSPVTIPLEKNQGEEGVSATFRVPEAAKSARSVGFEGGITGYSILIVNNDETDYDQHHAVTEFPVKIHGLKTGMSKFTVKAMNGDNEPVAMGEHEAELSPGNNSISIQMTWVDDIPVVDIEVTAEADIILVFPDDQNSGTPADIPDTTDTVSDQGSLITFRKSIVYNEPGEYVLDLGIVPDVKTFQVHLYGGSGSGGGAVTCGGGINTLFMRYTFPGAAGGSGAYTFAEFTVVNSAVEGSKLLRIHVGQPGLGAPWRNTSEYPAEGYDGDPGGTSYATYQATTVTAFGGSFGQGGRKDGGAKGGRGGAMAARPVGVTRFDATAGNPGGDSTSDAPGIRGSLGIAGNKINGSDGAANGGSEPGSSGLVVVNIY